jgi:hypothetical protein
MSRKKAMIKPFLSVGQLVFLFTKDYWRETMMKELTFFRPFARKLIIQF